LTLTFYKTFLIIILIEKGKGAYKVKGQEDLQKEEK